MDAEPAAAAGGGGGLTVVAAALIPRLDLFISLIGALASSCLAIIFPAIIQMCTFWSREDSWDESNGEARLVSNGGASDDDDDDDAKKGAASRGFLWNLFVCKNFLLVVFGILGLITGSWISISELSASYMGIDDALE